MKKKWPYVVGFIILCIVFIGFVVLNIFSVTKSSSLAAGNDLVAYADSGGYEKYLSLGAYDTYTDNGNGTVVIHRTTGYTTIIKVTSGGYISNGGLYWYDDRNLYITDMADGDNIFTSDDYPVICNAGDAWISPTECVSIRDDSTGRYFRIYTTYSSISKLNSYLAEHPISIQYKLKKSIDEYADVVSLVYDTGYNKGYDVGSDEGETAGYNQGYADGLNQDGYTFNLVSYLLDPVSAFMNTQLFGSFTIANAFEIVLFVAIALIFIKMFAG